MTLFKNKKPLDSFASAFTERDSNDFPYTDYEREFYGRLRKTVPVLDAAINKIVRLVGDYKLVSSSPAHQKALDEFVNTVKVGISGESIYTFTDNFLDSLLTYGCSVGEILVDENTDFISGLFNADSTLISVKKGVSPIDRRLFYRLESDTVELKKSPLILYTALNPTPQNPNGCSILSGLPRLCEVLMRIYSCIGQNFDRVGNVRYAVTYKPTSETMDRNLAVDRANLIAKEWSDGMNSSRHGVIKDFVAVGDVDIKVIGAENQIIDTNIPVRQLLEQIVSKLSIPPFLLGLNWNSTERMSSQQSDILTSELEYFRRQMNPIIRRIADAFITLLGCDTEVEIEWSNINLQDECELALARLRNAQSKSIEENLKVNGG